QERGLCPGKRPLIVIGITCEYLRGPWNERTRTAASKAARALVHWPISIGFNPEAAALLELPPERSPGHSLGCGASLEDGVDAVFHPFHAADIKIGVIALEQVPERTDLLGHAMLDVHPPAVGGRLFPAEGRGEVKAGVVEERLELPAIEAFGGGS